MKNIFKLATILAAFLLLVSWTKSNDKTEIEKLINTYLKASVSLDYAKMKSLVTPDAIHMIEEAEQLVSEVPEDYKQAMMAVLESIIIDPDKIEVSDNSAKATISAMGSESLIYFKKINGKWLVDVLNTSDAIESSEIDLEAVTFE